MFDSTIAPKRQQAGRQAAETSVNAFLAGTCPIKILKWKSGSHDWRLQTQTRVIGNWDASLTRVRLVFCKDFSAVNSFRVPLSWSRSAEGSQAFGDEW
jgi:hypothetical protein